MGNVENLESWLKQSAGLKIFLDSFATQTLKQLQPEDNRVSLLAGLRVVFFEQERGMAKKVGFIPVKLVPRVTYRDCCASRRAGFMRGEFRSRGC